MRSLTRRKVSLKVECSLSTLLIITDDGTLYSEIKLFTTSEPTSTPSADLNTSTALSQTFIALLISPTKSE